MTDSPRTVSRARKLARKVVPVSIRSVFVTTVDTRLGRKGRHHLGAPRCDMTIPEAQALTEMAEDLGTGARDWSEWNPDLACTATGPSRQELAAEEAAEAARQAWEQLGIDRAGAK